MTRTFFKTLLAATMLVPAVAQAQDAPPRGDGGERHEMRGRGPGGWQGARPDWRGERPQPSQGQPGIRPDRGPGGGIDRPRPDGGWQGARSDGARPDGARPDGQRPDGQRPGWQRPDGQRPGWQRPDGQRPGWQGQRPQPFQGQPRGEFNRRPDWSQDRRDRGPRAPDGLRPDRLSPDRPVPNRLEVDNRGGRPPLAQGRPDWRGGNWNPQRNWGANGVTVHRGDDGRRGWDGGRNGWNRGWRDDRRYDWNRYRGANRAAYRLPHYYAPSGWGYGYRRFTIGATLWSGLWGSNYWIDDPFDYRLPEAYGPYRWVRYYDDALLVDVRNGRVVDVVYDIFW